MLKKSLVALALTGAMLLSLPALQSEAAWKNTSTGKQYTTSVKPGYVVGWKKLGGSWYYFNQKGIMQTGWKLVQNKWYYMNSNGKMAANTWIGNYYVQADGSMACNTYIKGVWIGADGPRSSSASSSSATPSKKKTGWYQNPTTKAWYYYSSTGKLTKGWISIASGKYYLNTKGIMLTGFQTISKKPYYFNSTGSLQKGWIKIKSNYYYASTSGVIQKSTWVDNNQYHMNSKGIMDTGWTTISGKKYYFHPTIGYKYTDWKQIGSKWYYFDKNGVMVKSKWVTYGLTGQKCYLQSDGSMAASKWVGEHYVNGSGYRTGQTRTTGLYLEQGKYYYADSKYNPVKGWKIANGFTYYFGSDYAAVTGWQTIDGSRYYFNSNGEMQTGLKSIGNYTYYFDLNGMMLKSRTITLSGIKYEFDKNGRLVENLTLGGKIALFAQKFIGNPYAWAGTSLTNGADCSGFTMSVMANFGIRIPRVACDQATGTSVQGGPFTKGKQIIPNTNNLQPGDLVFYYSPIGHVALYIGNGRVVHASNEERGITTDNYNYSWPVCAMRYW